MAFLYNRFRAVFTNAVTDEAHLEAIQANILDTKQQAKPGKEISLESSTLSS
jgi:hypothetical protein